MGEIIRIVPAGDAAVLIELGDAIDPQINRRVHSLADLLMQSPPRGIGEAVPAYASLLLHYDPAVLDYAEAIHWVEAQVSQVGLAQTPEPRLVELPTLYGGEHGPDLSFVAQAHGLTEEQVIRLHSSATYTVYMMGFTPGFGYLGGLPESLATPRLEKPRTRIRAGSVGIAGSQTGVYPIDSPGGWRIIGFTPLRLFDPLRQPPTLLSAGDRVRFIPITPQELDNVTAGE